MIGLAATLAVVLTVGCTSASQKLPPHSGRSFEDVLGAVQAVYAGTYDWERNEFDFDYDWRAASLISVKEAVGHTPGVWEDRLIDMILRVDDDRTLSHEFPELGEVSRGMPARAFKTELIGAVMFERGLTAAFDSRAAERIAYAPKGRLVSVTYFLEFPSWSRAKKAAHARINELLAAGAASPFEVHTLLNTQPGGENLRRHWPAIRDWLVLQGLGSHTKVESPYLWDIVKTCTGAEGFELDDVRRDAAELLKETVYFKTDESPWRRRPTIAPPRVPRARGN